MDAGKLGYCIFCALFFTISSDARRISIPFLELFMNVLIFILRFVKVCFNGFKDLTDY